MGFRLHTSRERNEAKKAVSLQWRSGAVAQWRSGAVAQWRSGAAPDQKYLRRDNEHGRIPRKLNFEATAPCSLFQR
jgi:hypothetical protein